MAIRYDDIGDRLKAFRLGSSLSAEEVAASFKSGPGVILPEQALAALTAEERARRTALEAQLPGAREQLKKLEDLPKVYAANAVKPERAIVT